MFAEKHGRLKTTYHSDGTTHRKFYIVKDINELKRKNLPRQASLRIAEDVSGMYTCMISEYLQTGKEIPKEDLEDKISYIIMNAIKDDPDGADKLLRKTRSNHFDLFNLAHVIKNVLIKTIFFRHLALYSQKKNSFGVFAGAPLQHIRKDHLGFPPKFIFKLISKMERRCNLNKWGRMWIRDFTINNQTRLIQSAFTLLGTKKSLTIDEMIDHVCHAIEENTEFQEFARPIVHKPPHNYCAYYNLNIEDGLLAHGVGGGGRVFYAGPSSDRKSRYIKKKCVLSSASYGKRSTLGAYRGVANADHSSESWSRYYDSEGAPPGMTPEEFHKYMYNPKPHEQILEELEILRAGGTIEEPPIVDVEPCSLQSWSHSFGVSLKERIRERLLQDGVGPRIDIFESKEEETNRLYGNALSQAEAWKKKCEEAIDSLRTSMKRQV
jgi:hypothetical protein